VVKTVSAFLDFCYIARRNIITDDSLDQLKNALDRFHESRQIFCGTVREEGLSGFSLPRQHSMVHYYDHIKNFGSPNGLCSSITESKHIAAVKRPWRRSNKHAALPQILKVNERLDKIAAARADFAVRGMMEDSCLVQAIKEAFANLIHDDDDPMDPSDSDETDSEVSDDGFQILPSRPFNDAHIRSPSNVDASIPDSAYEDTNEHTANLDDDHPQPLPTFPNDEEDDDHGPVESGPLMNEVRLVGRKGQIPLVLHDHKLNYYLQRLHGSTPRRLVRLA